MFGTISVQTMLKTLQTNTAMLQRLVQSSPHVIWSTDKQKLLWTEKEDGLSHVLIRKIKKHQLIRNIECIAKHTEETEQKHQQETH
jgi:hypothetical protein